MARGITAEGVKKFLNGKGIKEEETVEEFTTVGLAKRSNWVSLLNSYS
jgi:hypothetical protein